MALYEFSLSDLKKVNIFFEFSSIKIMAILTSIFVKICNKVNNGIVLLILWAYAKKNPKLIIFFSSFNGWFDWLSIQDSDLHFRFKADSCIWDQPTYICAHCRTWVYPYQGDASHHTPLDPASLRPPAPQAHGAARCTPFGLSVLGR